MLDMTFDLSFLISMFFSVGGIVFTIATNFSKIKELEARVRKLEDGKYDITLTRIDEKLCQLADLQKESASLYKEAVNNIREQFNRLDKRMDEAQTALAVHEAKHG